MFKMYIFPIIMYILVSAVTLAVNVILAVMCSAVFFGAFAVIVGAFTGSYTTSVDFIMYCIRLVVIGISFGSLATSWVRFPTYLSKYQQSLEKKGGK